MPFCFSAFTRVECLSCNSLSTDVLGAESVARICTIPSFVSSHLSIGALVQH